jgi:predicted PurR-regulated permease PerM
MQPAQPQTERDTMQHHETASGRSSYTRRVLLTVGIVAAVGIVALLLWYGVEVILLAFAGLLLAIFLRGLADWVNQHTSLGDGWALAVVLLALIAGIVLGTWLLAPALVQQGEQLTQRLPQAAEQLRQRITQSPLGQRLVAQIPQPTQLVPTGTNVLARVTGIFSTLLGVLVNVVIVLFIGIYLAADPELYTSGIVHLVPLSKRKRAREVLSTIGYTLKRWLLGRLAIMAINGAITALGLWLLGIPLPFTLGLLTAILNFIPNIGPILAGIPAVLLALPQGPTQALYVVLLYLAVQNLEGFVLTPLVQQHNVSVPPALIITAQILLGILFGFLGVLLAVPITAVTLLLVKMLYVEDTLGDAVEVQGEQQAKEQQHA